MLGLVWTEDDISGLARGIAAENKPKTLADLESATVVPKKKSPLRFPMSLLIRPEIIDQLTGGAASTRTSKPGMPHVPNSAVSMSDLPKEDYMRMMGATPVDDRSFSSTDMFDKPSKKMSGFDDSTFGNPAVRNRR